MTISAFGFDVDSANKPGFSFRQAYAAGYRVAMIKFGGMNMDGNAPYMMNGYHSFVDEALAAGFTTIFDYIVTGGSNPEAAARFWLANRHGGVTAHVVDNEKLDYGNIWNDGQVCAYHDVIGSAADRWMYGSRDSLWNAGSWPGLAARRVKAHVAIYNGSPLTNCYPRTYPAELVLGHQYTSSATIGGLGLVDADAFAEGAFAPATKKRKKKNMLDYVTCPNPAGLTDAYVIDHAQGTYYWVPNVTHANYIKALAAQQPDYIMIHENQSADILAGLVRVADLSQQPVGAAFPAPAKITAAIDASQINVPAPVVDFPAYELTPKK